MSARAPLWGASLSVIGAFALLCAPAHGQTFGGDGGSVIGQDNGGAGGAYGQAGEDGQQQAGAIPAGGGGGGGVGAAGGTGGDTLVTGTGGAAGSAGASGGGTGGAGGTGGDGTFGAGGGGGGGGGTGLILAIDQVVSGGASGGQGGDGGAAGGSPGGGGAGGFGLVTTEGVLLTIQSTVTGGVGGDGGRSNSVGGAIAGAGGGGGYGAFLSAGTTLDNPLGTVAGGFGGVGGDSMSGGGAGGSAGPAIGAAGAADAMVSISNGGTIGGGRGGAGGQALLPLPGTPTTGHGGQGGDGGAGVTGTYISLINDGVLGGGWGGAGGNGLAIDPIATGGAGGAGGAGVTGSDMTITNTLLISGGVGGAGGTGTDRGGDGGTGGAGISGTNLVIINKSSISGGDGGAAGPSAGTAGNPGAGGVGIVGSGLDVTTAGVIKGGLSGDGATRANAVEFSGGGNSLTLEGGYSFQGNVVSTSGTANGGDALVLGGAAYASFDVGQVVPTLSGSLSGTQYVGFNALSVEGGTWNTTGTNASGLAWTLNGGTLAISDATTLEGAGPAFLTTTVDGGTLAINATLTLNGDMTLDAGGGTLSVVNLSTGTLAGALSGSGDLTKTGFGTLALTNANGDFTGATTISEGTLALVGAGSIAQSSAVTVNAELNISGAASGRTIRTLSGGTAGYIDLGANTLEVTQDADGTYAGQIRGTGGLTKSGSATLTFSGTALYYGATLIDAGTFALSGNTSLSTSSAVTVNGTFDISAATSDQTINTLAGSSDGSIVLGARSLTVRQAADGTFGGVISGTGAVRKLGSSTLTFEGVNTFTGEMVVDDGTLALSGAGSIASASNVSVYGTLDISGTDDGATIHTLGGSLIGRVVLGAEDLTVVQDSYSNFAGIISGTGGLVKQGTAVLSLQGVNTYTGDTLISEGGLSLMADGSIAASRSVTVDGSFDITSTTSGATIHTLSGASTGTVTLWVKPLTVVQDEDGTFAGVISDTLGRGTLTKEGTATLTLTGANTYGGGTTISAGTLKIGDGGTSGSIVGNVANNAALVFDRSDASSFDGIISGTGTLGKDGAGTLTLTGVNTFTGATTISEGTLALAGAGSIAASAAVQVDGTLDISATTSGAGIHTLAGAATGAVVLGALTLTVDQGTDGTFAGVISGSGGLNKEGAATLILTGANSYTGTTTINAGILKIGDGGDTGLLAGDVVNNASLVFDRRGTYGYAASLSGTGTTTFMGGGTVDLGASGAFSGTLAIEDATVRLQMASLPSAIVTVGDGGVLSGAGTIGALILNDGSVVAPGFSPGTIHVAGPVAFNAGSLYQVDVSPDGQHDLISATGAVIISSDAKVEVSASPGVFTPGAAYTIVTTTDTVTGVFGTFDSDVVTDYAFLTPNLTYDAQNVYLTLTYNGASFTTFAETPNERSTARAVQALGVGNDVYDAVLQLPRDEVAGAFATLSGEAYASLGTVILQQSVYVRDAVMARLGQAVTAPGGTPLGYAAQAEGPITARLAPDLAPVFWAQGYGGWGNSFGDANAATISNTVGGVVMGADVALSSGARVGLFAGYGRSTFDVDQVASSGVADNYDIGAYAGARFGAVSVRGALAYAWHDAAMDRTVAFPGFTQALSSSGVVDSFQAFGELGYALRAGALDLEPFVGLSYVSLSGGDFQERGGAAALGVDLGSMQTLYTTLGLRAAAALDLFGQGLTSSISLGWQHAFGDTTPYATMLFTGGTMPFEVTGVPVAEDTLLLGAGLGYELSETARLSVDYSAQIASGAAQNAVTGRFALRF